MPLDSDWTKLHPLSPLLRSGRVVIVVMVVLVQQLSVASEQPLVVLGVIVAVIVAATLYGYVSYQFSGHRLEDEHLEVRSGVVFRSRRRVPLLRIESIDIVLPLVPRLLGLVELRVEVASTAGSEIVLRYLSASDADELRNLLTRESRGASSRTSAPGDIPVATDVVDPVALTATSTADQLSPMLTSRPLDTSDHRAEREIVTVSASELVLGYGVGQVVGPLLLFGWLAIVVALIDLGAAISISVGGALGVGAVAFAALRTLDRMYGFTLRDATDSLVVQRGLLNQLTQKVPLARIQGLRIEEPFLWKPFGRKRLIVDIAGYRGNSSEARAETAILLPIGTGREVDVVLDRILGRAPTDLAFTCAPERAKWRAPIQRRSYGVYWSERYAIVRSGVFRTQTDIIPHRKMQSLRKVCGPWQRRLDLATLYLDTAGTSVRAVALHRDPREIDWLIAESRARDRR